MNAEGASSNKMQQEKGCQRKGEPVSAASDERQQKAKRDIGADNLFRFKRSQTEQGGAAQRSGTRRGEANLRANAEHDGRE